MKTPLVSALSINCHAYEYGVLPPETDNEADISVGLLAPPCGDKEAAIF